MACFVSTFTFTEICLDDCSGADDGWTNLCDPSCKSYALCAAHAMYDTSSNSMLLDAPATCGGSLVFDAFKGCQYETSTCTVTSQAQSIGQ